jgi:hypothetical protein
MAEIPPKPILDLERFHPPPDDRPTHNFKRLKFFGVRRWFGGCGRLRVNHFVRNYKSVRRKTMPKGTFYQT